MIKLAFHGKFLSILFMNNYIVKRDLFNISNRIKSIDRKYFIVFNKVKNKYEIHYDRIKNTYELTIPYNELDARTVNLVLKTRIENKKALLEQMEQENLKLEKEQQKQILEKLNRSIYES